MQFARTRGVHILKIITTTDKKDKALFGWWVIESHHSIPKDQHLKLITLQLIFITWKFSTYTQLCLALKPGWVFILKTQKSQFFKDPRTDLVLWKQNNYLRGKEPLQFSLLCYYHFFSFTPIPSPNLEALITSHRTQKLSSPPTSSTQTQHPRKEKRNQAKKPSEKERKEKKQ